MDYLPGHRSWVSSWFSGHSCVIMSWFIYFVVISKFSDAEVINDSSKCHLHTFAPFDGRRCYIAVNLASDWHTARNTCLSLGGHVVTLTSQGESEDVIRIMKAKNLDATWLGTQEHMETWRWLDEREVFRQGCFKDNPTDPDFVSKRFNGNNNYDLCRSGCQTLGYSYGGVQSGVECWCGPSFGRHGDSTLCNVPCKGNTKQMCGGEGHNDVFAVKGTFSNWGPSLPNNHLGYQSCAELEAGNHFFWNDAKCTESRGAICQIDNSSICDTQPAADGTYITTNATVCYLISYQRLTWFQARYYCNEQGGDLVAIDNQILNQLLVSELQGSANRSLDLSGFWFGLTRSPWKWTTGEKFLFTSWKAGDPNGNQQHCATMDQSGLWQDTACDGRSKVLCEIDTSLPATTTPAPSTSAPPPSTTTLYLRPVRGRNRYLPFTLEDKELAAIVAGGVVMLIIIIIFMSVFCHCERKRRARMKEEKKESKRQKFFFGLGKDQEDMDTLQRENRKSVDSNQEVTSAYENQGNDITEKSDGEYTAIEMQENRHSGLSDKPDLIPEVDSR